MKVIPSSIPGLLILEPEVFGDERGFFYESFNERAFANSAGINVRFVQDNHSRSGRNVLRGLHYQIRQPQGKLVRVTNGEVFDVTVDIRKSSATFGKWSAEILSEKNRRMRWIPPGFAHGFLVTSDCAEVQYKTTDYWAPQHERCIVWNDPALKIDWPLNGEPVVSKKDRAGVPFKQAEVFA
ncbi:MAG: dTDP-4-dehydrorhamnose 3,5-epimerase [Betaproteobacteria bacterium]|nr:dTDP-4-dehydrorhamnose 3,5-epimerase [Betaproteobacteria bacterium]